MGAHSGYPCGIHHLADYDWQGYCWKDHLQNYNLSRDTTHVLDHC